MATGGGVPSGPAWRTRLATVAGFRRVVLGRQVIDRYASAGGPLLAAGLAYSALFALIPGILLILGIGGVLLGDGRAHEVFVRNVVAVLPPLRDLLEPAVDELSTRAGSMSLLGALGLAWGASRFYDAFELAMARMFDGSTRRGFLRRTSLGLLSVAGLGLAFTIVTVLAVLRAFVEAGANNGDHPLVGLAGILLDLAGPIAAVLAVAFVYRMIPPRRTEWTVIAGPAITVAVGLVLVARLFIFVAPRLIGAAAVLGTLATVFAALAWLELSFQAVLLGAVWVDLADRNRRAVPTETLAVEKERAGDAGGA